jgi:hypothetical protein
VEFVLVGALVVFTLLAAVMLFRRDTGTGLPKSALQKRGEIIEGYKRRMDEALKPYLDDPAMLRSKKAELLREFSTEVSSNIFFGPGEVREVIRDLAHYRAGEK